jgi:hypothetical protein
MVVDRSFWTLSYDPIDLESCLPRPRVARPRVRIEQGEHAGGAFEIFTGRRGGLLSGETSTPTRASGRLAAREDQRLLIRAMGF